MHPFLKRLGEVSPSEQEEMLKRTTAEEREALVSLCSERQDDIQNLPPTKNRYLKVFGTIAVFFIYKVLQEIVTTYL